MVQEDVTVVVRHTHVSADHCLKLVNAYRKAEKLESTMREVRGLLEQAAARYQDEWQKCKAIYELSDADEVNFDTCEIKRAHKPEKKD